MKIYISQKLLNSLGETPKSLSVEMRRQTQTEYALESNYARIFGRGNARTAVAFTVERAHASEEAARIFSLKHSAELDAENNTELEFAEDGFATLRLKDAVISKVKTDTDGIITNTKYEFIGTQAEEIS